MWTLVIWYNICIVMKWYWINANIPVGAQLRFLQSKSNQSFLETGKLPTVCCTCCGQPERAQHEQLRERQRFDISTTLSWAKHVWEKKASSQVCQGLNWIMKLREIEWPTMSVNYGNKNSIYQMFSKCSHNSLWTNETCERARVNLTRSRVAQVTVGRDSICIPTSLKGEGSAHRWWQPIYIPSGKSSRATTKQMEQVGQGRKGKMNNRSWTSFDCVGRGKKYSHSCQLRGSSVCDRSQNFLD